MELKNQQEQVRKDMESFAAGGPENILRAKGVESNTINKVINLVRTNTYKE